MVASSRMTEMYYNIFVMGKRGTFCTPNWNLRTEPKRTSHM
jgi:hypothetical protein